MTAVDYCQRLMRLGAAAEKEGRKTRAARQQGTQENLSLGDDATLSVGSWGLLMSGPSTNLAAFPDTRDLQWRLDEEVLGRDFEAYYWRRQSAPLYQSRLECLHVPGSLLSGFPFPRCDARRSFVD